MRSLGYATLVSPEGKKEWDSFTCIHCNRIVHVKPKMRPQDMGGFCYGCGECVCAKCVGKPCTHIMKRIEAMEASYHARRSYGF